MGPNYSVRIGDRAGALHLLYWGGCLVARARTHDELAAVLATHLGGHAPPATDAVRLDGIVFRRDDEAFVLTRADALTGVRVAGRLRRHGIVFDPRPWADVDSATGTLAPTTPLDLATGPVGAVPALRVVGVGVPAALVDDQTPAASLVLQVMHEVIRPQATIGHNLARFRGNVTTVRVESYAVDDLVTTIASGFSGSLA